MLRFGSLKKRFVVLITVPVTALLAFMLLTSHYTAKNSVEASVRSSLNDAGSVFVELVSTRQRELVSMAWVTAHDPRFFATLAIPQSERGEEFGPTLEGIAHDFVQISNADFLEIFDANTAFLTRAFRDRNNTAHASPPTAGLVDVTRGVPIADVYGWEQRMVVSAAVPVYVGGRLQALVRLGSFLDETFVSEVRSLTSAEVCLAFNGQPVVSTFPHDYEGTPPPGLSQGTRSASAFRVSEVFTTRSNGHDFLGIRVQMKGASATDRLEATLGRERQAALQALTAMESRLAVIGAFALILTVAVAFALAGSVTRPLATVVEAARKLQRGDYEAPLQLEGRDEVAFLGQTFEDMRESLRVHVEHLRSVDRMKSDFITLAGHEIKTPLTVISSFNQMISDGVLGELPKDVQDTSAVIQEQLLNLDTLVENIMYLTRVEQDLTEFCLEPVDVREVVQAIADRHAVRSSSRQIALSTYYPPQAVLACCDRPAVHRAVTQLLDNAVRFTPDGGEVTVKVGTSGDAVQITVRDTGIGIDPEHLRWIFDKGFQTGDILHHSSGRLEFGSRGLGIGLSMVRSVVEAMGGTVEARSHLGAGSVFTIALPRIQAEEQAQPSRERDLETVVPGPGVPS